MKKKKRILIKDFVPYSFMPFQDLQILHGLDYKKHRVWYRHRCSAILKPRSVAVLPMLGRSFIKRHLETLMCYLSSSQKTEPFCHLGYYYINIWLKHKRPLWQISLYSKVSAEIVPAAMRRKTRQNCHHNYVVGRNYISNK